MRSTWTCERAQLTTWFRVPYIRAEDVYDNDGDLDLLVTNLKGSPDLLQNEGNQNTWLSLKLIVHVSLSGLNVMILTNPRFQYVDLCRPVTASHRCTTPFRLPVGTRSNRDAIGAQVKVTIGDLTQIREVRSGSSYLSQSDMRLHFGLGKHRRIDRIEIRWPSGLQEHLEGIEPNQTLMLVEGNVESSRSQ